jgi:predicted DNA-binding protein (MmcQ/YjbR family)
MSASSTIRGTVTSWPGISEQPGRFEAVEFMLGKREIGHLHGDVLLDVPFPRRVRDELVAAGEAEPHHIMPESGWISFRIRSAADADHAVALLRRSYDLINQQLERRRAQSAAAKA